MSNEIEWYHVIGEYTDRGDYINQNTVYRTFQKEEYEWEVDWTDDLTVLEDIISDEELDWSEVEIAEDYESRSEYDYPPEVVANMI
ncbi:hypothetical protein [Halobacterium noricense]|uniref:hypothetical protein n=1 Tax=Halobacterium noricense TaxID=223182 RepID=UPI001E4E0F4F|nr:hypothetical protein [Halobacterium noricense]UHH25598.1 hypothetical protein LT974_01340 [Halobacterium noricense]